MLEKSKHHPMTLIGWLSLRERLVADGELFTHASTLFVNFLLLHGAGLVIYTASLGIPV